MLIYQYYSLGNELLNRNDLKQAREYFQKCLELSDEFDERETMAGSLSALGNIAFEEGKLAESVNFANKALEVAEDNQLMTHLERGYELLYDVAMRRERYQEAVNYLTRYHEVKDSIQSKETLASVEEFKVKYETAEKEKKIDSLNFANTLTQAKVAKERTIKVALIVVIAVVILFSVIVYFTQRKQSALKQRALTAEISELRFQIKEMLGKYEGQIDVDLGTLNQQLVNPLSQREFDVLQQVFMNKTNQEIADDLFVSINTVKTHLKNIYPKLGVTNRSEALKSLMLTQR
jgi:ATP/maltotriose-dependent transcriptional regulator MalT